MRALEDDPVGYSTELWKQLAELDLLGLMLPVEYGGSGMSALEGVVVYEEFGRALVPSPHFVSAVMSAGLLLRAGSARSSASCSPRIASGDEILTTAWLEPEGGFGPAASGRPRPPDGDGFRLDGTKWHVPFASSATRIVVLARTGDADDAVDLFLVDPDAPGVELDAAVHARIGDPVRGRRSRGCRSPRPTASAPPASGWATWNATLLEGVVFLAAQAIGGARAALELTDPVREGPRAVRQAARRVPGDRALPGRRVDERRGRRDPGARGRWPRWRTGRSIEQLAPMAKLFAVRTYRDVTAMAQQVFGGVGFTLEYDIQLYFRRAKQQQISWWDDRALEERIAACVLDDSTNAAVTRR